MPKSADVVLSICPRAKRLATNTSPEESSTGDCKIMDNLIKRKGGGPPFLFVFKGVLFF